MLKYKETIMRKKMIARNISLPDDLYNAIKDASDSDEMSVSELFRNLAIDFLKKRERMIKRQKKEARAIAMKLRK